MVLFGTMSSICFMLCIVKGFFRLMENVLYMVLYRAFLRRFYIYHQKGICYCDDVKLLTVTEPFLVICRTNVQEVDC